MKRKLLASVGLFLILVVGVFSPITIATKSLGITRVSAQDLNSDGTYSPSELQSQDPHGNGTLVSASGETSGSGTGGDTHTEAGVNTGLDQDLCGWTDWSCKLIMGFSTIISGTPFLLAVVSGLILDFSLYKSIQSGTYTAEDNADGNEGFVVTGWKLVRDFSNLIFIFALFVVAFVLILGLDNGEGGPLQLDPKKTVARVIIMALLVNFSFFMGRSIIEVTNIIALGFYGRITSAPAMVGFGGAGLDQSDIQSFYSGAFGIRSISIGILAKVNPQQFVLQNKEAGVVPDWSHLPIIWFYTLVAAAFSLFLVYLFVSIAILFIARTIGLFFGLILSPLAFVSYVVPFLRKQSFLGFDDWMKQFFGLAFMAPIFMFFLYIGIQFFNVPLNKGSGTFSIAAFVTLQFAAFGFILILGKKITKDLSGKVGSMVSGAITSVVTTGAMIAGAVATGGASAGLAMGRRVATQAAVNVGNRVIGSEKTEAIQQRLASTNFSSIGRAFTDPKTRRQVAGQFFGTNLTTNASGTIANLARLSGSKMPDQVGQAFAQGQRKGKMGPDKLKQVMARADNINKERTNKNENLAEIDKKMNDVRTKYSKATDPNERATLVRELSKLSADRKRIEAPALPSKNQANENTKNQGAQNAGMYAQQQKAGGSIASIGTLNVNKLVVGETTPVGNTAQQPVLPQRTFGDGKGPKPVYTEVQQERILRKAIAAEGKRTYDDKTPNGKAQNLLSGIQNGYEQHKEDVANLGTLATQNAQSLSAENLQKMYGGGQNFGASENPVLETKTTPTLSGTSKLPERRQGNPDNITVPTHTPDKNNDIDFSKTIETPGDMGGIQLPNQHE